MKVLQDIESLQQGKIDKAQIKNNLTETTVGNVLDATQGKVLSEQINSLEEKISWKPMNYKSEADTPSSYGNESSTIFIYSSVQQTFAGYNNCIVKTYVYNLYNALQIVSSAESNPIKYRICNGPDIWTEWKQVVTQSDVGGYKVYSGLSQLGCTVETDVTQIPLLMPNKSILISSIYTPDGVPHYPTRGGLLTIKRHDAARVEMHLSTYDGYLYFAFWDNGTYRPWQQIVTTSSIPTFTGGRGNIEGGEIRLARPENDTTLQADVSLDIYGDSFRIFENGGKYRGVSLNLGACYNGSDSKIFTNTKTSFSCTANTGYTIVWQDCYVLNGFAHIHVRIKATDNTVWGTWQHACFTTPYSTGTKRVPLTLTPYVQPELMTMGTTTQNGVIWQEGYQAYITPSTATSYGYEVKCIYEI